MYSCCTAIAMPILHRAQFPDSTMPLNKPKRLRPGGTIALVAPASPLRDEHVLHAGICYLESLGYRIVLGESLRSADGYLAGTDALRAAELNAFFSDPTIDAIFCVRGGYGTMRLLDLLDWDSIARSRKIFVGFSDITALQWALYQRAALPTVSGLMVAVDFANLDPASEALFWSLLCEPVAEHVLWHGTPDDCLQPGSATGPLMPGTLSLVAALCGTEYMPSLDGCILVLEDIGEEPYRIDRMLCQLALSGQLRRCSGIAFGTFTEDTTRQSATPRRPVEHIIAEYVVRAGNPPSILHLPYGHIRGKLSLPVGISATLNADRSVLMLTESLVD